MTNFIYLAAPDRVCSVPFNPLSMLPGGDIATSAIQSMTAALNGMIGSRTDDYYGKECTVQTAEQDCPPVNGQKRMCVTGYCTKNIICE